MSEQKIKFFGYGLLRSRERMLMVIGREPEGGQEATLEGYTLAIQSLEQIPKGPRESLRKVWGDSFRAYTLRPGRGSVTGVIWELSPEEYEKVKRWELVGHWRESDSVQASIDGNLESVKTIRTPNSQAVSEVVDGGSYETNLNPYGEVERVREDAGEVGKGERDRFSLWGEELARFLGDTEAHALA